MKLITISEEVLLDYQHIAKAQKARIAELEAEVALLKKPPEKTLGELFVKKVFSQPDSPEIEQARKDLRKERFHNNMLQFEEGEG